MRRALPFALAFCFAVTALAEDTIGMHVVKQGDTFASITARYLGNANLWRQNWKLNPGVRDPNMLLPGQRLRVIIARTVPAQSALIRRVSRHVEKKPEPEPWTRAQAGDRLLERHGVQTFAASSAELRFDDETTLTLTEQSLVFLRPVKPAPSKRDRSAIEIIDGHADLAKSKKAKRAQDFEIIVGSTTAAANDPAAQARFRNAGAKAVVMSYRGTTAVASAGATVKVASGMGVSVPDGERPPAPEKLLSAPRIQPFDVSVPRPSLRWAGLDGAKSYAIEICRDRACAEVVARAANVEATEWRPIDALPAGSMFWRVTARSATGLDGYPAIAPLVVRLGTSGVVTTGGRASEGVRVALYRGTDHVADTRTDANGGFGFGDLEAAPYSIVVDSRSISATAWAEEVTPSAGGRRPGVSDDASTLATAEHVREVTLAGSPVDGLDFGFSFDAVTHAGDGGQGSLRQFMTNANLLGGTHTMQFLAERAAVKLTSPLPRLTGPVTIAGRATREEIGSVTTIGASELRLHNPSRAALSIDFGGAEVGIDARADLTVRDVMLIGATTHIRSASKLHVENTVIGELLEPRDATGIEAGGETTLRRVLIASMARAGIVAAPGARIDAEDLELNGCGEGMRLATAGSRARRSLFLLNETAIAAPVMPDLEESTFRGNREPADTTR